MTRQSSQEIPHRPHLILKDQRDVRARQTIHVGLLIMQWKPRQLTEEKVKHLTELITKQGILVIPKQP